MSKYNQPLSKQEALQLKKSNPKVVALYPEYQPECSEIVNSDNIESWKIDWIYEQGYSLYITREDYAMYIREIERLPKGYAYANKPFGTGIYDGLSFWGLDNTTKWSSGVYPFKDRENAEGHNFWQYCFSIEDLARVENTLPTQQEATKELIDREMPKPVVANVWQGQEPQTIWEKQKEEPSISEPYPVETISKPYTYNRTLSQVLEEMKETLSHSQASNWYEKFKWAYNNLQEYYEHATNNTTTIQELEAQITELEQDYQEALSHSIKIHSKAKVLISHYKDRAKLDRAITKLEEELNG